MTATIILRSDSAERWKYYNPTLEAGEPGLDYTNMNIKIGDGSTRWNDLEYIMEVSAS